MKRIIIFSWLIVSSLTSLLCGETYRVPATSETTTLGLYTLNKQPVVKIRSGDSVSMETWSMEYFRVLVWSDGKSEPDLLTNGVDVVPNKTYTVRDDLLVPAVLMAGTGC